MTPVDEVYAGYLCQIGLLNNLQERARAGHDDFLRSVRFPGFPDLPLPATKRRHAIQDEINRLRQYIDEMWLLVLVAAFERTVFDSIEPASQEARSTIENAYPSGRPLHAFRRGLIKETDDFYNLGGFKALFSHHPTTAALATELAEIIDYRDFLAHGKRGKTANVKRMAARPTLESAKSIFDQIIRLL